MKTKSHHPLKSEPLHATVRIRPNRAFSTVASAVLFGALMISNPGLASADCTSPDVVIETLDRKLMDTDVFIDSVVAELDDDYMGYSVILTGPNGAFIGKAKYGLARTCNEPEGARNFNHNTQTAWGSVTKMITAALVIDKTERSASRTLDDPFWTDLPADWRPETHPDQKTIQLRHLLSHKSGFSADVTGLTMRERIGMPYEKTPNPDGSFNREYENINFALFGVMGRFFRADYFDDLEADYETQWQSVFPDKDDYIEYLGTNIYEQTLNSRILNKLNIDASCNTMDYLGSNWSKWYSGPSDNLGYEVNPIDKPGCTTGGIIMSAHDMASFVHALIHTDDIIHNTNYLGEMAIPSSDRLGWEASTVEGGYMYWKNGERNRGSNGTRSLIVAFPNGASAVFTANSPKPDTSRAPALIFRDAYEASLP